MSRPLLGFEMPSQHKFEHSNSRQMLVGVTWRWLKNSEFIDLRSGKLLAIST